jgi:hypothetical protein
MKQSQKSMCKRWLCLLLSIIMLSGAVSLQVFAETALEGYREQKALQGMLDTDLTQDTSPDEENESPDLGVIDAYHGESGIESSDGIRQKYNEDLELHAEEYVADRFIVKYKSESTCSLKENAGVF